MRLVTFVGKDGPRIGAVLDGSLVDLNEADSNLPRCLVNLIADKERLDKVRALIPHCKSRPIEQVQLLAPIPRPGKIVCVGLNYADHAAETGAQVPPEPVIFNKFPTAVCPPNGEIVLPEVAYEIDYEAELVVVIGKAGKNISPSEARSYVAGYCCGNDVSARDWQLRKPGGQWLLGKSFDTFAPIGPWLVTADEIADPHSLDICLRLNGREMQRSNTRQLIFPIEQLISYVSKVCTLEPGDLLFTGTPGGVGMSRKPPVFLKPGDIVEVEIAQIGTLRNKVVAAV